VFSNRGLLSHYPRQNVPGVHVRPSKRMSGFLSTEPTPFAQKFGELTHTRRRGVEITAEPSQLRATWLETEQLCSGCSRLLPLESFPPNPRMYSGRGSRCRECAAEASRDWRRRNRDEINAERRARYRAEHPPVQWHCVVCGEAFEGRPDRLVCSERCRNRRKHAQKKIRQWRLKG
jgi:predicted nucleic acid-binding Zn ribbon protein